jgi:hypothetical protein
MTKDNITDLEFLVEKAKNYVMSADQEEVHRRSFAYGNSAFENPGITRQIVEEEAKRNPR